MKEFLEKCKAAALEATGKIDKENMSDEDFYQCHIIESFKFMERNKALYYKTILDILLSFDPDAESNKSISFEEYVYNEIEKNARELWNINDEYYLEAKGFIRQNNIEWNLAFNVEKILIGLSQYWINCSEHPYYPVPESTDNKSLFDAEDAYYYTKETGSLWEGEYGVLHRQLLSMTISLLKDLVG
ncbi:hypothetical protein TH1_130 [Shewanella phage Thanatos-1]|nr:hypothetical protein TH1_130 [Shewanella phage Thanatos-1]